MTRQRRARERQKKEDTRPTLKKLRAALLWSFSGQHNEKIVCARGVPWVTGTLKKDNSHFDPIQTGSGTAHNVEAVVDWSRKNAPLRSSIS